LNGDLTATVGTTGSLAILPNSTNFLDLRSTIRTAIARNNRHSKTENK
jgi:hypothetical protein